MTIIIVIILKRYDHFPFFPKDTKKQITLTPHLLFLNETVEWS